MSCYSGLDLIFSTDVSLLNEKRVKNNDASNNLLDARWKHLLCYDVASLPFARMLVVSAPLISIVEASGFTSTTESAFVRRTFAFQEDYPRRVISPPALSHFTQHWLAPVGFSAFIARHALCSFVFLRRVKIKF
jgi:hypothetical protein